MARKKKFSLDGANYLYLLSGLIFLVAFFILSWFGVGYLRGLLARRGPDQPIPGTPSQNGEPIACLHRRLLDGVCVESEEAVNPKLLAIMIENNADAWPLAGVAKAAVVYEAPVEANIPRFLALYPEDTEIEKVGPVRSARPYYLDWVQEYGQPFYMHVGGSAEALKQIEQDGIIDFDEFYRGWYFWRSDARQAPHNTYTSTRLWGKAIQDYPIPQKSASGWWLFAEGAPCVTACVTDIRIPFNTSLYEAGWKFVSSTNTYIRYLHDKEVRDEDESRIVASTVIVQKTRVSTIDTVGRKALVTIGAGDALIFRNGQMIEGTWKKVDRTARTEWFDSAGNPISLQPGTIWVEVVDQTTRVKTSV